MKRIGKNPAILAIVAIVFSLNSLVLAGIYVAARAPSFKAQPKPAEATARQLMPENGVIPVELQDLRLELISSHTIKETRLNVLNHTRKTITAVGLTFEIHFLDAGGIERVNPDTLTVDYLLTADLHKVKPIGPDQKGEMLNLDADLQPGFRITGEVVSIDYVEFDDHTTLGPDKHTSATINAYREGAAKYKAWIRSEYQKHDRNVSAILPLLDEKTLPSSLALTGKASGGANVWRVHLKEHYQTHGKEGLEEILNQ
jgi:hypothetical protein